MNKPVVVLFIILCLIIWYFYSKKESKFIKAHVINLEKNKERYERFMKSYDLKEIPIERFNAIVGKDLDPEKYLSKNAYKNLLLMEEKGYRLRHSELSRGAIGCYLSHVELYRNLIEDDCEYYLIFEDDATILPDSYNTILEILKTAPKDWDVINLSVGYGYTYYNDFVSDEYIKYKHFFGTLCYIINKKGARKFIKEFESKPMTMQIDSKMSHMIQNDKLVMYGCKNYSILERSYYMGTDIQVPIQENDSSFILEDE